MARGDSVRRIKQALEEKGCKHPHGWRCPAHDDRSPSLSVNQGDAGAVIHCHAGCTVDAILGALGLVRRDLFDEQLEVATLRKAPRAASRRPSEQPAETSSSRAASVSGEGPGPVSPTSPPSKDPGHPLRVAEYLYTDANGEPLGRKVRFEPGPEGRSKAFIWERPAPHAAGKPVQWVRAQGLGAPSVLYHLTDIGEWGRDRPIHFCEGEKAVEALLDKGWHATCPPTGKITPELLEPLRGHHVRIWVDRDEPGEKRALQVASALKGIAASIAFYQSATTREHDDAFDHLAAGHGIEEAVVWSPPKPSEGPILDAGIEGERLLRLLARPPGPPITPGVPPRGHLSFVVAPPFTGKTSLALWIGLHVASGTAPWGGAPEFEPGRVLYLSIDASAEEIVKRLDSLSTHAPNAHIHNHAERWTVVAQDREIELDSSRLKFTNEGLAQLESAIRAREYTHVWIDAHVNFLPDGVSENDNTEAARVLGGLQAIATRTQAAVCVLHHEKKPAKDAEVTVASAPRGATAIAASARAIFRIEQVKGFPHLRKLTVATNLGECEPEVVFSVNEEGHTGPGILYWRTTNAPAPALSPTKVLQPGEVVEGTAAMAAKLRAAGISSTHEDSHEAAFVARITSQWEKAGLLLIARRAGSRGANRYTLLAGSRAALALHPSSTVSPEEEEAALWS